jgi:V-type H+-transporting ATPase subunit a
MSLFRSERMGYFQLIMPRENAWEILNDLGEASAMQFVDRDPDEIAFTRPFAAQVKRCEEIESNLKSVENFMIRFNKKVSKCSDTKSFLLNLRRFLATRNRSEISYLDEVEFDVNEKTKQLDEQIKTFDNLKQKFHKFLEYKAVLMKTKAILGESQFYRFTKFKIKIRTDNELI